MSDHLFKSRSGKKKLDIFVPKNQVCRKQLFAAILGNWIINDHIRLENFISGCKSEVTGCLGSRSSDHSTTGSICLLSLIQCSIIAFPTEAAFTLLLYCELLQWEDRPLREFLHYPSQSEWQRKEGLCRKIIHYFNKGKVCQLLLSSSSFLPFSWLT